MSGALVGLLAVAGCSREADVTPPPPESGTPTENGTPTESPGDEAWTVESLEEAILEADTIWSAEPIGSTAGTVSSSDGDWNAEVQVLSLVAHETGTDLYYLLRSLDGQTADTDWHAWGDGLHWIDTRSITVTDEKGGSRLLPYTTFSVEGETGAGQYCICSAMPKTVGEGDVLGALLPPLDPATMSVTIEFPGLKPITDVPVEWN